MKILLCDDSERDIQLLTCYINRYAGENLLSFETKAYPLAERLLSEMPMDADLIFLDVYMGQLSGMQAAKLLLERGYQGLLIFTTTSTEHAVESYLVNAVDYLLKPFPYERFAAAMDKCMRLKQEALRSITAPSGKIQRTVLLKNITYIESAEHRVMLHCGAERIPLQTTMTEMQAKLEGESCFLRCHRCYLINLNHVDRVEQTTALMDNGESVLLAVREAPRLRRAIAEYLWNKTIG